MAAPMMVHPSGKRTRANFIVLVLVLASVVGVQAEGDQDETSAVETGEGVKLESVFESISLKKQDLNDVKQEAPDQKDKPDQSGTDSESPEDKLFSITSVIKSLLNPVIEEFQVGVEEQQESTPKTTTPVEEETVTEDVVVIVNDTETVTNTNQTVAANSTAVNGTDSAKKYKFQCVGRNVTEDTTLEVRLVNSTTLLEVLSFDKNRSSGDCVLVMFYAPWCQFCAKTAPHYNALARAYPQLEVLAVDAVHFSNLNARFGTVAVPNLMLFHQSRSAVRFNHTERLFTSFIQFIKNVTGLEPNATVNLTEADYLGPLSSIPTEDPDYLLWLAWVFVIACSTYMFVNSRHGQQAINRVRILWQEHQHIE